MPRLLILLLAVVAAGYAAEAPAHGHGTMAAANPAQAELGAGAAFDARGNLWAVHKVSGHLAVSRSPDRGVTWQNPVLVTPGPEPTDAGGDARPKLAVGSGGELYLTWTRPLAKPYSGEIRFARSVDGGRTFSPSQVVHRDRQEITHRFDALAVNARGQVFVAWIDKRDLVAAAAARQPAYRGAAVYFAVSDDGGVTFRGDFKAADHACECCRIALAPAPDGTVTALWRHVFAPNIRDHAAATLYPDGSATPVTRVTADDWRIDVCPHHGPGLARDGRGGLHAVWFSAAPQRTGVFYGRLGENGAAAGQRLGGVAAEHADVAAAGDTVAIAWKEFDGERTRLRGRVSSDGGERWREVELASTEGASDHPRILTFGGRCYVLWNTREQPLRVLAFP